ncbi:conserved hypothetical protein [Beutenbergia cavernae DSM 12333]|uniref:Integral membrane protein n=1 Tax=Beutenbergia cavernae (strain ATCC BAA-8 / DSM 12333 / CCUG 43141 / JCM 11478 / NBRC 16432 / NCIMB 13614 / HKI 0122) TaxID=471853 RepID=C5C503_BEUC1|nr:hypothetical protein [Beutenbergia cavernae]ACQ80131.1 conserved hypothetical protein [Beutenbergia cavernae DSM 12333]
MLPTLGIVSAVIALLCLWAAVWAVRDRAVILKQLIGAGVVEVGLLAQLVVAGVGQARGHHVAEPVTLWGYLITALLLLPFAGAWALVERTRWSSVVLVVACLALLVVQLRIGQVWQA